MAIGFKKKELNFKKLLIKKENKWKVMLFWDYIKATLPFYQEEQKTKLIL